MYRFSHIFHALPRLARQLACLSLAVWLSACSNLEFPWVYRINIDQGNIITQDMVNKLKPGMTRDQVKFVMGSPLLVDPFHTDRWDYVYTLLKADGERTHEQLTVYFKNDQLASLNGDFLPAAAQVPAATPASPASSPSPTSPPSPATDTPNPSPSTATTTPDPSPTATPATHFN